MLVLALAFMVAGCASGYPRYAPGEGSPETLADAEIYCKRQANVEIGASDDVNDDGSMAAAVGAAIGGMFADSQRAGQAYRACMEGFGYVRD